MRFRVTIDRYGRVVIPAAIRKKLNIKGGDELIIELRGSTIIIQPVQDLDEIVEKWFQEMLKMRLEAKELCISGGKWYSDEYAKRKLGID